MAKKKAAEGATAGFTAEERTAMKERARELKAEARAEKNREAGEKDIMAKIAEMPDDEGAIATRVHEIISEAAPELMPKTWYGMPAYAREGKILCFFQAASKYETRYSTLGFNDSAALDDGAMWPVAFALRELTPDTEEAIAALVRRAVGEG